MPRVTLRDLANRQHGPSKATREWTPIFGGWLRPRWCSGCVCPLTSTDLECGRCTSCDTPIAKRRTR